jgi:hypothetical protein
MIMEQLKMEGGVYNDVEAPWERIWKNQARNRQM